VCPSRIGEELFDFLNALLVSRSCIRSRSQPIKATGTPERIGSESSIEIDVIQGWSIGRSSAKFILVSLAKSRDVDRTLQKGFV
jgi:hypothetical protein